MNDAPMPALAALVPWLRAQAERVAVKQADAQRERIKARLRVADQRRDAQGRWTKEAA